MFCCISPKDEKMTEGKKQILHSNLDQKARKIYCDLNQATLYSYPSLMWEDHFSLFQPLSHLWNKASLFLFYYYCYERYSDELHTLIPIIQEFPVSTHIAVSTEQHPFFLNLPYVLFQQILSWNICSMDQIVLWICREEENLVFCFGALFNSTLNFTQSGWLILFSPDLHFRLAKRVSGQIHSLQLETATRTFMSLVVPA